MKFIPSFIAMSLAIIILAVLLVKNTLAIENYRETYVSKDLVKQLYQSGYLSGQNNSLIYCNNRLLNMPKCEAEKISKNSWKRDFSNMVNDYLK